MKDLMYCPKCDQSYTCDEEIRGELEKKFPGKEEDFYEYFVRSFDSICKNCETNFKLLGYEMTDDYLKEKE